jgi:nicotinamidase-related amidase
MTKTALLVLDMQNELVDASGKVGAQGFSKIVDERGLIPRIRKVQEKMREKALPVVFVRVGFRADYVDAISQSARLAHLKKMNAMVIGTSGTEFPSAIAPRPDELIVTKRAVNPFFNTQLETWLRLRGVTTLGLCGVHTHMVVHTTAQYADDSGFVVKVLEDCCASPDPELHRVEVEKILPLFGQVMSSSAFLEELKG